jgi:hypothetical protein
MPPLKKRKTPLSQRNMNVHDEGENEVCQKLGYLSVKEKQIVCNSRKYFKQIADGEIELDPTK